jgi:hypothetical protein
VLCCGVGGGGGHRRGRWLRWQVSLKCAHACIDAYMHERIGPGQMASTRVAFRLEKKERNGKRGMRNEHSIPRLQRLRKLPKNATDTWKEGRKNVLGCENGGCEM